jgi:hypothetical protein
MIPCRGTEALPRISGRSDAKTGVLAYKSLLIFRSEIEQMSKAYSIRNESSPQITAYLAAHPIELDGQRLRKGGLIAEVKHYCEQRTAAGRPLPLGQITIAYDGETTLELFNEPHRCRITGIGGRK